MSMTFYAYRETARGPEFSDGPNFSNANARMILRSLGYGEEIVDDYGEPGPLDPRDLKGRCLTALAVGGAIADDGMPAIRNGNVVECALRPGYFRSAYERILPVCDQAEAWGTHVTVA